MLPPRATMSEPQDEAEAQQALADRARAFAGQPYMDESLTKHRMDARELMYKFNHFQPPSYKTGDKGQAQFFPESKYEIIQQLFGFPEGPEGLAKAKTLYIEPPLYVDYGTNIKFKGWAYMNYSCHILDGNEVSFGVGVQLAPLVQIYAATHSVDVAERKAGWQRAYAVDIGDDVWIGGGAIIIGPCTIGKNCTVAAGAVVRGTFPDNVVIAGNPARIIKHLDPTDPAAREQDKKITTA